MNESQRPGPSAGLVRVFQIVGVTLPLLGALLGGLLAWRGDHTYERETGKVVASHTLRGDVIAGVLSGFMLAVLLTFFLAMVVALVRRLRRGARTS